MITYIYSKGKSDNNIFYTSTFIKKVCSIFIIYMKMLIFYTTVLLNWNVQMYTIYCSLRHQCTWNWPVYHVKDFKKCSVLYNKRKLFSFLLQALGPQNSNGWTIDSSGLSFISTTSIGKRYIAEIFRCIINFIPNNLKPECVFPLSVLLMEKEGRRKGGKKWYQLIYTCINIIYILIYVLIYCI